MIKLSIEHLNEYLFLKIVTKMKSVFSILRNNQMISKTNVSSFTYFRILHK